jgi:hypothetical protein
VVAAVVAAVVVALVLVSDEVCALTAKLIIAKTIAMLALKNFVDIFFISIRIKLFAPKVRASHYPNVKE